MIRYTYIARFVMASDGSSQHSQQPPYAISTFTGVLCLTLEADVIILLVEMLVSRINC